MKVYAKLFVLVAALCGFLMTSERQAGGQTSPCETACSSSFQSCLAAAQSAYETCEINAETDYLLCLNAADNEFENCDNDCSWWGWGSGPYVSCYNGCVMRRDNAYLQCEAGKTNAQSNCFIHRDNANTWCNDGYTHCLSNCSP